MESAPEQGVEDLEALEKAADAAREAFAEFAGEDGMEEFEDSVDVFEIQADILINKLHEVEVKSKRGTVTCYFDRIHRNPLSQLQEGMEISVVGECDTGTRGPILRFCRLPQ